ncbi:MAG: hypothetical protein JJU46_14210 [Balneolaceae bacterium]|nr:hypothetical protein [Balneolaceae bacterium]MCH8548591.1 hypothetical protein [Balneolaceae bacterium]
MEIEINRQRPLHLFEGYGVELEYMVVDSDSLNPLPVSDRLLAAEAGRIVNEHPRGNGIAWSNELALHIIEFKTDGPARSLEGCASPFQKEVLLAEEHLKELNGRLMPGPMHPWMDPFTDMKLWPHEYNPIYESYNRIFDCRGHGWANLQSTHLNLPFCGDEEFEKLHAAVRIILPLIPAMAAGSPIADGMKKEWFNFRMEVYRTNSLKIPSVTGSIIPEQVFTREEYEELIFEPMYRDIAPYDRDGILQDEWLNSRGAISRWDRNTIEVRVTDIQECPAADLAIAEWICGLAKSLIREEHASIDDLKSWHELPLAGIFMEAVKDGELAQPDNLSYSKLFGFPKERYALKELTAHTVSMLNESGDISKEATGHLELILEEGPLARRILRSMPESFDREHLRHCYEDLCGSLRTGTPFIP